MSSPKSEQKEKVPEQTSFYMDDEIIAEQITYDHYDAGRNKVVELDKPKQGFAIWKKNQSSLEVESANCYEIADSVAGKLPILDDDAVKKGLVKFPTGITRYTTIKELLSCLQEYIHKWVDVRPLFERISSYAILTTWTYDLRNTIAYISFLGDFGTGKSRGLNVVGGVCYKPIKVSGAITPAPIYRLIEKYKGTLLIDEGDFKKSECVAEIIKILNCGFEKGNPVVRCDKDHPDKVEAFDTYCPKAISRREIFIDQALESRCLTEVMKETIRADIPIELTHEFYEEQEVLRRKLLCFRMRELSKKSTQRNVERDTDFEQEVEPRLRQATSAILSLLNDYPEELEEFKTFLRNYNNEIRKERAETFDGQIVTYVVEQFEKDVDVSLSSQDIAIFLTDEIGMRGRGGKPIKAATVGRHLKSLGFITKDSRDAAGKPARYIQKDSDLLARLKRKYCVADVTDVTAVLESITQSPAPSNSDTKIKMHLSPCPVTTVTTDTETEPKVESEDVI